MSKLVEFTDVHFPDLNPNSYDKLNNMKLDLNVSTNAKFNENDLGLSINNQGNYKFLLSVLLCIF